MAEMCTKRYVSNVTLNIENLFQKAELIGRISLRRGRSAFDCIAAARQLWVILNTFCEVR